MYSAVVKGAFSTFVQLPDLKAGASDSSAWVYSHKKDVLLPNMRFENIQNIHRATGLWHREGEYQRFAGIFCEL
jgi:hypothetical protein